jgi:hypothetical protein
MNLSDIFLSDGRISPTLILWAFYIAVVVATVIYYVTNAQMCKLVSKLLEIGAFSPETAVNLAEIDISINFLITSALRSPMNYKDFLVAITDDGKYYANYFYTDEPPIIRQLTAITRIRKSRVTESSDVSAEEPITESAPAPHEEAPATPNEGAPQKVKFNPLSAKYYIPKEVHDKVKNLYKSPKIKPIYLILLLIGFAAITFLASIALDFILSQLLF